MKFENQAWDIIHNVRRQRHSYDLGIGARGLEQWLPGCSFSSLADNFLHSPLTGSCRAGKAFRDLRTKIPRLLLKINRTVQPKLGNFTDKRHRHFQTNLSEIQHHSEYSDLDIT